MDDIQNWLNRYTDRDDPPVQVCLGCGQPDCECDVPEEDDGIGAAVWCECGHPLPCPYCVKGGES